MDHVIIELLKLVGPLAVAAGYVRGRLNGLVHQVACMEQAVEKMEDRYANCRARIKAEADEKAQNA